MRGCSSPDSTLDTDVETWDEHFDVNVKACFLVCARTLPAMIEQGTGGRVINNASIGAKLGDAGLAAYDASKHALLGFSRCLAAEMGEHRITVNCLCPRSCRHQDGPGGDSGPLPSSGGGPSSSCSRN